MKKKQRWSLRLRLSLFFAILLLMTWSIALVWSWLENRAYINEFFDTQQMLFAKRLAAADFGSLTRQLPDTEDLFPKSARVHKGEQEDDALGFAIFDRQGRLLLSDDENGSNFIFAEKGNGFANSRLRGEDDLWRIVWLPSLDGRALVAVGQELDYRADMVLEMLAGQMLPWLLLLPVLLICLAVIVGRELAPLRSVAANLEKRAPADVTPIETEVPAEARPLVRSLNNLFLRVGSLLRRERTFISDAAHELRTPLAGLSIQAQVAQIAKDPAARAHALEQLMAGIKRASRLTDQLLMLFKLESQQDSSQAAPPRQDEVDWAELLTEALAEAQGQVEGKNLQLREDPPAGPAAPAITGNRDLLAILLRNLVSNAVKYTPPGGRIEVALDQRGLSIANSGHQVPAELAPRLGERFFRPPGQREPGSGLGLSIARRIAQLHGLRLVVRIKSDWFEVKVLF
ncbi:MAG: two-component system sensor histidine kinase QseC [Deltaproteobacteria bacterium]|jgi:two-component system sensor histidine kinase QseC|nr:two-component system sensor histidine kinase QseC [Deltaproteobacteria bacterium]